MRPQAIPVSRPEGQFTRGQCIEFDHIGIDLEPLFGNGLIEQLSYFVGEFQIDRRMNESHYVEIARSTTFKCFDILQKTAVQPLEAVDESRVFSSFSNVGQHGGSLVAPNCNDTIQF